MNYNCEGRNLVHCDPKMQELEQPTLPLDGPAREQAFQEVAKYAHDQIITVPIGYPDNYDATSARLDSTPRAEGLIAAKELN
jgi:hypothetical protein